MKTPKTQPDETESNKASESSSVKVYIQISREDQRPDALKLSEALREANFVPAEIELVTGDVATVHTYVRFFSAPGALQASRVKDVMNKFGYQAGIQDFSAYTQSPLASNEIWIGKNQGPLPKN